MECIRLMIISDNQLFGKGLSRLLQHNDQNLKVEAIAPLTVESLTLVERSMPDFIIFNIFSPEIEAPGLLSLLSDTDPESNILVITPSQDPFYIRKLKTLNINGCICDDISTRRLINVIHAVYMGKFFFDNKLMHVNPYKKKSIVSNNQELPNTRRALLTKREKEILKLALDGYNSRLIASKLSISVRTVQNHRANIMKKLQVKNVAEMIKVVYRSDVLIRG